MALAQRMAQAGEEVIFTGGEGEESLLEKVQKMGRKNIHILPAGGLTLREFAAVISQAKVMVSNSTGPLHMAVALGVPTLSFYPNAPIQTSPKRWGPWGDSKTNGVLTPKERDGPMSSISVDEALGKLKQILSADSE